MITCPATIVDIDGSIAKVFIAATSAIPMNRGGIITGRREPLSSQRTVREERRVITKAAVVPITPAITAVASAACALVSMPERNACSPKISRNHRSDTPWGGQLRFDPPFTPYITTTTSGR